MAKGSKSKKSTTLDGLLSPNTLTMLAQLPTSIEQQTYLRSTPDAPIADRRRYHPARNVRPADALIRDAARIVIGRLIHQRRFAVPNMVAICLRRKVRREVLHAFKLTRKSGRGGSPRRRNFYSQLGC